MTSARVYRRRRLVAAVLGLLLLTGLISGTSYTLNALAAPLPAPSVAVLEPTSQVGQAGSFALPSFGRMAVGATGFDGPLLSSGDQGSAPIASITKVITALVVLEAKPLAAGESGPDIEYGQADVERYQQIMAENGSVAPVSAGLVLSQRESLELMLVPSANNYAYSLAEWAYGSLDAFLAASNDYLAARGLSGTRVVEPSGLSPLNVSNPAELVTIGKLALEQPALAEIVALESISIDGVGDEDNTNKLLGRYGVNGVKTGTTDEAGACLLFSSTIELDGQAVTMVGVLLGGESHAEVNQAVGALLESMVSAFRVSEVVAKGDVVAELETVWGDTAAVIADEAASVLSFSDLPIATLSTFEPAVTAPAGTVVGSLSVETGSQRLAVPLSLREAISDPGPLWRLAHPNRSTAGLG